MTTRSAKARSLDKARRLDPPDVTTVDDPPDVTTVDEPPQKKKKKTLHHVVVPRFYRNTMMLTMSNIVTEEMLKDAVTSTIQSMRSKFSVVMSVTKEDKPLDENDDADEVNRSSYIVVFLDLPSDLTNQLKENGILECVFYVGSHEDTCAKVLSGEPTDDMIAKKDRQGNDSPYSIQVDLSEASSKADASDKAGEE